MALAELLDALRRQGALNRADELERARGEAERIREASHRLIEVRTREHRARVEAEAGEDARRTLARAEGEAREAILSARRHLLRRVEEAVRARLSHADGDPTYVASLPSRLQAALDRLPPGPVAVRAPPSLARPLADATAEVRSRGHEVTVETLPDAPMGFTAYSADGCTEVDASLSQALQHAWPELAIAVVREAEG